MQLARRADPIVAIATAPGRAAVGIVRISGPSLLPLATALCGEVLTARHATLVPFLDARGEAIDRGLALFFPAPHSYTGEDVLELQAHGGPVVLQLLMARCLEAAAEDGPNVDAEVQADAAAGAGGISGSAVSVADRRGHRSRLPNLRIARPGEFTERAFFNDKLDLAQAEAVADLIDAGTEAAARSAARAVAGAFSSAVAVLAAQLVDLRMLVEATLDFPDEEIEFLERARVRERLAAAMAQLDRVLAGARQGALLRDGIRVVLAGQPNVGKSSLLNALAGAELAIVTPVPGTTRDRVGETIQIEGVPVHVIDTAGLRETSDAVERIGVARSWQAAADADVVVFLHDLTRIGQADYDAADQAIAERLAAGDEARLVHAYNKLDAAASPERASKRMDLQLSAVTGTGIDALRHELLRRAGWQPAGEDVTLARARHVDALTRSRRHLGSATDHASRGAATLELVAEELRAAHDALAEITGEFSSDDLLGVIFTRFCIGK